MLNVEAFVFLGGKSSDPDKEARREERRRRRKEKEERRKEREERRQAEAEAVVSPNAEDSKEKEADGEEKLSPTVRKKPERPKV